MTPRPPAFAATAVVTAVLAAYLPALGASFQFDDFNVIVHDARVQSLGAWAASMPGMRPLLKLSYALNHELGGGVRGFRALNIAIHALNAVLVLRLLEHLSRWQGLGAGPASGVAFTAALVFALHPAQTEAVTYVSGRSSALVALWCLATMLAWLRAIEGAASRPADPGTATVPSSARWWAALFAALALATKESAVVLPLALILWWSAAPVTGRHVPGVDALPADPARPRAGRPLPGAARSWVVMLHASWPLLLVFIVSGLALLSLTPYRELIAESLARRGPGYNLLAQSEAIPYLTRQLLHIGAMNADPDLRVPRGLTLAAGLKLAALAVLVAGAVTLRRRCPAFTFGVLWYCVWLVPTHSVLPRADLANDRQLYLALVGPVWLATFGTWHLLQRLCSRLPARRSFTVNTTMVVATTVTLAIATLARNRVYTTEVSFWEDAVRRSPYKARTANNLGYAYALACRDADAAAKFTRATALDPADSRARVNRRLLEEGALVPDGGRHCR